MFLVVAQKWKYVGVYPITGGQLYRLTARDDAAGDNNLVVPVGFTNMVFMVPLSLAGLGPFAAHGVSYADTPPDDLVWTENPGVYGSDGDTIIADLAFDAPAGWSTNLVVSFWADVKTTLF